MLVVLAPLLLCGCYTMISQTVYARPEVQIAGHADAVEETAPADDDAVSEDDSGDVETDQQGSEAEDDNVAQDGDNEYKDVYNYGQPVSNPYYYESPFGNYYYDMRYRPVWSGSYIWDPYPFTPHLHFGMTYNSWDPFYWHDPWVFGFNYDPWYYSWYSPYYSMYDPWYYNRYSSWNDNWYGGYDNWHYGSGHGGGNHDGYSTGLQYARQDRLAGFGAYSSSGGIITSVNATTGKTASETGGVQSGTRVGSRGGFGTSNTRRSGTTGITEKSTAVKAATSEKNTVLQDNSTTRKRTNTGGMIRRGSSTESYTITIPNDDSGKPLVQYRDQKNETGYQKEIRISRQAESTEENTSNTTSVTRRSTRNGTQARRARVVNSTQTGSSSSDNTSGSSETVAGRSETAKNSTSSESGETNRTYSPSPSRRDTGGTEKSTGSYSTPSRGGSSSSYSPRSGGGSSSGSQTRSSGSRSGGRRR